MRALAQSPLCYVVTLSAAKGLSRSRLSVGSTCPPCGCHPERSEGSVSMGTEMLPLHYAQGFGSCAQHDITGFACYISLWRESGPPPRRDQSRSHDESGTYAP